MHIHFLIAHVTVLLIVAFFILFAGSKADGLLRLFGSVLGIWVILVAILHIVGFLMPGAMGMKDADGMHTMMHRGPWMQHWGEPATPTPGPAPASPAPKKP